MSALKKINDTLEKCVMNIAGVLFLVMTALAILQVGSRYAFNQPLTWTEEYARFIFSYVVLFGSAILVRKKGHVTVTLITEQFKGSTKETVEMIAMIISLIFIVLMVYYGYMSAQRAALQTSAITETNMGFVYASVPISGLLMLLFQCETILDVMKKNRSKTNAQEQTVPEE